MIGVTKLYLVILTDILLWPKGIAVHNVWSFFFPRASPVYVNEQKIKNTHVQQTTANLVREILNLLLLNR